MIMMMMGYGVLGFGGCGGCFDLWWGCFDLCIAVNLVEYSIVRVNIFVKYVKLAICFGCLRD